MRETRPMEELGQSGLLWLINKTVFIPRGFVLSVQINDDKAMWTLFGNGTQILSFGEADEDALLAAAEKTLNEYRPEVKPPRVKLPLDVVQQIPHYNRA